MAVLALGFVGVSAFGAGTFAAAAFAFAGSVIDSQLLFPQIFGRDSPRLEGPRLDDLSVQTASEGSPSRICFGPQAGQTAGAVIWATQLIETPVHTSAGGGKGFIGGGGGGGGRTDFTYSFSCAVHICDTDNLAGGAIDSISRVWANGKLIYNADAAIPDDSRYGALRFYNGAQSTPDTLVEATLGSGNTPAYVGSAYFVIEDLELADFGNRAPNFTVLVKSVATTQTVADVIDRICALAGLPPNRYNTSLVTGDLSGLVVVGEQEPAKILEILMHAYNIVVWEADGALVFADRDAQTEAIIDDDHLGAVESGQDPASVVIPFWREDSYNDDKPRRTTVGFLDPDCNWERSSRSARKRIGTNEKIERYDLPLTLSSDEASEIAVRSLWSEWGVRERVEGWLPPKDIEKQAGDVIIVTANGIAETIRLESVTRGDNYIVRYTGYIEEPGIFVQSAILEERSCIPPTNPFNAVNSDFMVIASYMVVDLTATPGGVGNSVNADESVFWCFSLDDPDITRYGGLYTATDPLGNMLLAGGGFLTSPLNAHMGLLLTAVPAAGDENDGLFWDRITTIDVELKTNDWLPATETEELVLSGENHIVVQAENGPPELLGFATVTNIGTRRYRLSNLLRGRRGTTEGAAAGYAVGNPFVRAEDLNGVRDGQIRFVPIPPVIPGIFDPGDGSETRWWKVHPNGVRLSAITAKQEDLGNGVAKPLTPCDPRKFAGSSGDLTIAVRRRGRRNHRLFIGGFAANPTLDFQDRFLFEIDILDPAGSAVLRTKTTLHFFDDAPSNTFTDQNDLRGSGYFSVSYPASEWAADGYSAGDAINIRAYQLNSRTYINRGHPLNASI